MHAWQVTLALLQASSLALGAAVRRQDDSAAVDDSLAEIAQLAQAALDQAQSDLNDDAATTKRTTGCTPSNIKIRREWGSLSKSERTAYINAVKCLQSKPAKSPSSVVPGAKTRFDDFVGTHINQTLTIHYTGNFLGWHRYYTWLYEQALVTECGYKGTQPYWDWALTAKTGLKNSPIFDGSDTSMSGDGEFIPDQPDIVLGASTGLPPIYLPAGTGGGCVTSGPFKNLSVNLGPVALDIPGGTELTNPNGNLAYNPRCLKRDLSDIVNQRYANASSVLSLIKDPKNVYDFEMQMQGIPGSGSIGVHGGGHYTLGGDPGRDVFVSPGDPMFYLHHAQIDRMWWIWQMLSPIDRQFSDQAVIGTNTFLNNPPSANTTLDDYVEYGFAAGPPRKLRELTSTLAGPFCYLYL